MRRRTGTKRFTLLMLWFVCMLVAAPAFSAAPSQPSGTAPELQGRNLFIPNQYNGQLRIRYLNLVHNKQSGDAILVQTPDNKTMLIDAGIPETKEQLLRYLDALNVNVIDAAVNTHPHIDHVGGFTEVAAKKQVKQVYRLNVLPDKWGDYYKNFVKIIQDKQIPDTFVEDGFEFQLGADVRVEVINPPKGALPNSLPNPDHIPVNNHSMVLKLTYKNQTFLFPADTYMEKERELIGHYGSRLKADFLHAGHHGMVTSTSMEWVETVAPKVIVASSNHFTNIRLQNQLKEKGIEMYTTMDNGNLLVVSNGTEMKVFPELEDADWDRVKDSPDEPVRLTFYYMFSGTTFESFMAGHGNYMKEKYPNITFKYLQNEPGSTLDDIAASDDSIDVFITNNSGMAAIKDKGLGRDITDLIDRHHYDLSRFNPSVIESLKTMGEGKLPGLPFRVNSLALFYNKSLFDKFGVPYPREGWTWNEVMEAARQLTRNENGVQYRGLGTRTVGSVLQLNQQSLPLLDAPTSRATIHTEAWKQYFAQMTPFFQLPGYNASSSLLGSAAQIDLFQKQRTLGMLIAMNSDYPRAASAPGLNWDVAPFPAFEGLPGVGSQPDPVYYAISANSKHPNAAFAAIAHMASDEVQARLGKSGVPTVLKDLSIRATYGSENADLKTRNARHMLPEQNAAPTTYTKNTPKVTAPLSEAFTKVILRTATIEDALRAAEDKANADIAAATK
jgi:beta-lactamase superfamily II metal-dependent hydrolase/ABC-type glycerol-3-phosphate transport system substrate-binding protein